MTYKLRKLSHVLSLSAGFDDLSAFLPPYFCIVAFPLMTSIFFSSPHQGWWVG